MKFVDVINLNLIRGSRNVEKKWSLVDNFIVAYEDNKNAPAPNSLEILAMNQSTLILKDGNRIISFMRINCP